MLWRHMKGVEICLHCFLNSAPVVCKWLNSGSGRFISGEIIPVHTEREVRWAAAWSGRFVEKIFCFPKHRDRLWWSTRRLLSGNSFYGGHSWRGVCWPLTCIYVYTYTTHTCLCLHLYHSHVSMSTPLPLTCIYTYTCTTHMHLCVHLYQSHVSISTPVQITCIYGYTYTVHIHLCVHLYHSHVSISTPIPTPLTCLYTYPTLYPYMYWCCEWVELYLHSRILLCGMRRGELYCYLLKLNGEKEPVERGSDA